MLRRKHNKVSDQDTMKEVIRTDSTHLLTLITVEIARVFLKDNQSKLTIGEVTTVVTDVDFLINKNNSMLNWFELSKEDFAFKISLTIFYI